MSNPLNDLLVGVGYTQPAAYTEEIIRLIAGYYGNENGVDTVAQMIRVADNVGRMRVNDAEAQWSMERRDIPWYKRFTVPKEAPMWYKDRFVQIQQARARKAYEEALEKMKG